jgi:hypothetical protein
MVALHTVEVKWIRGGDLNFESWRWTDGVVDVGHETGVDTSCHCHTWRIECGLCKSVVVGHECEEHYIPDCSVEGVRAIDIPCCPTYSDLELVRYPWSGKRN